LELAVTANQAGTTWQSPYTWKGPEDWKQDYSNPDKLSDAEIAQRREAFDKAKSVAKDNQNNSC